MADARTRTPVLTARAAGLVGCETCGKVAEAGRVQCTRCGKMLHSRRDASLQRVWAWLLVGIMCYIPANTLPMLVTSTLGRTSASTIGGGVIELIGHDAYGVAAIVALASIVIPVFKFLVIGYLALSIRHRVSMSIHGRTRLYEIVEFIGRWSMIDVFVVAILTALVQLGFVASINPGLAAVFFALSVTFTMLSAQAMDPRLIWDSEERERLVHERA